MTEQEARDTIIKWAKNHFREEGEPKPDVEVVSITHDEIEDEWEAGLEVSTSADNPIVTFYKSAEHGLQIVGVEY